MVEQNTSSATTAAAEPEWLPDERPVRRRPQPDDYVLHAKWFMPATLAVTLATGIGMVGLMQFPPWGLLVGLLGGSLLGLTMTLAAMAWAVAIVFADDARKGIWFVAFPPYMVVYAARRWSWMAQPTVLFLCGVVLALGVPWGLQWWLTTRAANPNTGVQAEEL